MPFIWDYYYPLKHQHWTRTYLPAFVIIISVSSRWNISQSSWFRRRAEIVLPSSSIVVLLAAVVFFFRVSRGFLDLEFRACACDVFRFEDRARGECVSTTTALGHVSERSMAIGISLSSCWRREEDFKLDPSISETVFSSKTNEQTIRRELSINLALDAIDLPERIRYDSDWMTWAMISPNFK